MFVYLLISIYVSYQVTKSSNRLKQEVANTLEGAKKSMCFLLSLLKVHTQLYVYVIYKLEYAN
jgi:hypothetical protein